MQVKLAKMCAINRGPFHIYRLIPLILVEVTKLSFV